MRLALEEPVAASAVWSRRLAVFALATAALGLALARSGASDAFSALTVFGAALAIAAAALLLAAAAAATIWRLGRRGAGQAVGGALLSLALLAYPLWLTAVAFELPPINDVTTDFEQPPTFMISAKARAARSDRTPPPASEEAHRAQAEAYPQVQPALLDLEAAQAYQVALRVASDLGWKIVDSNPPNLRGDGVAHIEAVDRTLFFGFADDIAIRIRPLANQTRIDLRSVSRVGRHDFGANAGRIEKFLAALREQLQER